MIFTIYLFAHWLAIFLLLLILLFFLFHVYKARKKKNKLNKSILYIFIIASLLFIGICEWTRYITDDIFNDLNQSIDIQAEADKLFRNNKYDQSMNLLKEALVINKGKYPSREADIYISMGNVLYNQGQYEDAKQHFIKANQIYHKTDGSLSKPYRYSLLSIANAYYELNDYHKSIEIVNKIIIAKDKLHEINDEEIALALQLMGSYWHNLNNYKKAIEYNKRSLSIYKQLNKYRKVAIVLTNIGLNYRYYGQIKKALYFHNMALEIIQEKNKDDHISLANALVDIGDDWEIIGNYKKALGYYEKANEKRKNIKNIDKEDYQPHDAINEKIGLMLGMLGQKDKAFQYLNKALESKREVYGDRHPQIAIIKRNMGIVLAKSGSYEKAIEYYSDSLDMMQSTNETEYYSAHAKLLYNFGELLFMQGEYQKAIEKHKESIVINKKIFDSDHPDVVRNIERIKSCRERLKTSPE